MEARLAVVGVQVAEVMIISIIDAWIKEFLMLCCTIIIGGIVIFTCCWRKGGIDIIAFYYILRI